MSNFMIALLFAIGGSGWVYANMRRRTGGNTQSSLLIAGIVGAVALLIVWVILGMIFKK